MELHEEMKDKTANAGNALTVEDICTRIAADTEGFPIDAFPSRVASLLLRIKELEGYNLAYLACSAISAFATAIGNAVHVRIKGRWTTAPSFFILLVGKSGVGKSPPMDYIFEPLVIKERELQQKHRLKVEEYLRRKRAREQEEEQDLSKPKTESLLLHEFTYEMLIQTLEASPRGINIKRDEFMGLLQSMNRYSKDSPLISDLLSIWDGRGVSRRCLKDDCATTVEQPCLNLIGTSQPGIVQRLFSEDFLNNGFTYRFLFVYPADQKVPIWDIDGEEVDMELSEKYRQRWSEMLLAAYSLPLECDGYGKAKPMVLGMTREARLLMFQWRNSIANAVNTGSGIELENERRMKMVTTVARLALVLHIMDWASSTGELSAVGQESMQKAIVIAEYLESCCHRLEEDLGMGRSIEKKESLLGLLADEFTMAKAKELSTHFGVTEKTIQNWLNDMVRKKLLVRISHGCYRKNSNI